jgi:tetratricopeptide (TPR) repeat protein
MIRKLCLILIFSLAASMAQGQSSSKRGDTLRLLLEEAGGRVHRKDYPAAIEKFNKVLAIDSNNVVALRTLGTIFMEMKDRQLAKDYFERAYKVDPNDPSLNNNLGAIASGERRVADAIRLFQTAIRFDSTDINFKINLALEYAKAGQNSNAMPLLKLIDSISPGKGMVLYTLGNCYASIGKFDSAEIYFDRSVEQGEKVDDLFYHRAAVKKKLGKLELAEKDYLTACDINPNNIPCRQALGMLYINLRRFAEATKQFETLVKIDSTYDNGWIGLGASYSLGGRVPDGDKVLQRLFAKDSALGFMLMQFTGEESNKMRLEKQGK